MRKNFQRVFTFVLALILALGFLSMVAMTVSANGNIDADDLFRPRITKQPASVKVAKGAAVEICVEATSPTDSEMTYVWYYKDKGASDFSESSVTTDTYTTTMSDAADGRQVYCVITNAGAAVQTDVATMTMANTLKITKQPTSVKGAVGKSVSISVQATGDSLTYQWYYKVKNGTAFQKSSTTKATYTVKMTAAHNGCQVYCVITDAYGNSVKSSTVTMSVNFCITKQPVSATVIKNKTVKLSVAAEGEGLSYQWYYKTKSGKSFKKLSSAKSSTYSVKVTSSKNGYQYYCVVKDKSGNTIQSSVATVKVAPAVKITKNLSSTAKVSAGKSVSVSVKASGDGLKYTWYVKDKNAKSYTKSSVTTATYSVTMSASVNGRKVYCVVTDKYGQTTKSKTCTLYANTTITKQPASVKVVNGKTATVSVSAAGEKLTYKWYYKDPGAKSFKKASGTKSTYSCTMTSKINGRQVYCVVKSKYGGSIKTNVVTISLAPTIKLAITKQPVSQAAFEGETVKFPVSAQGEGLRYQWYYKTKGSSSFQKSSNTTATYSVKMTPAHDACQIYCVITDKYGTKVQTKTVTLTMKEPIQVDLMGGYWGYLGQYREYEYGLFTFAFFDEEQGYVGVSYWQAVVDGPVPDDNTPHIEIDGVKYYMQSFGSERDFTYRRVGNTITMTDWDGGQLVVELKDSETMVIKSQKNFVCGQALTAGAEMYWVPYEEESPMKEMITKEPEHTFGNYGDTLTVTVEAEGEGLSYVWYEFDVDNEEGAVLSDQTTATYSMVLSPENAGREVYCVVYDKDDKMDVSDCAVLDCMAPASWYGFVSKEVSEDKQSLFVSALSPAQGRMDINIWRPLREGETPVEQVDESTPDDAVSNEYVEVGGVRYYCPITGWWRTVSLSVEGGLVKLSIKEADTEVAAIYMERTDFHTLKIVSTTGTISDIPGYIENFAAGDLFAIPR